MIQVVSTYRDIKIKRLQELYWWAMELILRGRYDDPNNFNGDIMEYEIEKFCLDYKYSKDGKSELNKPKELYHDKWKQW